MLSHKPLDLKKLLNPSQFAAVTTTEGPVLVIAGAGSGKTRVIEYRVLHLVANIINPHSILLIKVQRDEGVPLDYQAVMDIIEKKERV